MTFVRLKRLLQFQVCSKIIRESLMGYEHWHHVAAWPLEATEKVGQRRNRIDFIVKGKCSSWIEGFDRLFDPLITEFNHYIQFKNESSWGNVVSEITLSQMTSWMIERPKIDGCEKRDFFDFALKQMRVTKHYVSHYGLLRGTYCASTYHCSRLDSGGSPTASA